LLLIGGGIGGGASIIIFGSGLMLWFFCIRAKPIRAGSAESSPLLQFSASGEVSFHNDKSLAMVPTREYSSARSAGRQWHWTSFFFPGASPALLCTEIPQTNQSKTNSGSSNKDARVALAPSEAKVRRERRLAASNKAHTVSARSTTMHQVVAG